MTSVVNKEDVEIKKMLEIKETKKEQFRFRLITKEGYTFKVITELLKYRVKSCNFILDKKGIFIKTSDSKKHHLINMKLYAKNMKYFCEKQTIVGLNMIHLHKNFKSIKKKDGLLLYIENKFPKNMVINPQKSDFTGSTKNNLKIIDISVQDYDEPTEYNDDDDIPIYSKDFQKMIKDVSAINTKIINIQRRGKILRFYTECGDLYGAEVFLSDNDNQIRDHDDSEVFSTSHEDYEANFQLTDITQLSKVAGLSTIVRINANKNLPLRITMNLGNIGKTTIYTKSKEIIDQEEADVEEETANFYVDEKNENKEENKEEENQIEFTEVEE
jgi:proliferating cell nuclear antigen PCNA